MTQRPIKFRAWDKREKVMESWENILNQGGLSWFHHILAGKDKNFILLQFTGLKDKNGKEIYEGDIVEVNRQRQKKLRFEIKGWFEDSSSLEAIKRGTLKVEVIGNIYENPDLLK